jgi:hypothetical protein
MKSTRFFLALFVAVVLTVGTGAIAQSQSLQESESSTAQIQDGVAGGTFTSTFELSARVTAIDTNSRTLTLLEPGGEERIITVGPEAANFDQVDVGDVVNAVVIEELVVGILPEHAAAPQGGAVKSLGYVDTDDVEAMPDGTAGIVALAARGSQPGGMIATTTQVTATVAAIDEENRTATLRTDDGGTRTIPVRDDIDLSMHKVGERVVFQATEMIAISVEKQ